MRTHRNQVKVPLIRSLPRSGNGEVLTDDRHVAPVPVAKVLGKRPPRQARREHAAHESALLNGDLGHARQRVVISNHGRRVSDHEDIRVPWDIEQVADDRAARAVGFDTELPD